MGASNAGRRTETEAIGDRFLNRVFTEHELAYASQSSSLYSERPVARFAAKAVTLKVLRPIDAQPEWRSIQVVRTEGARCEHELVDSTALLAGQPGIRHLALSLDRDFGYATAVVVAEQHQRQQISRRPT